MSEVRYTVEWDHDYLPREVGDIDLEARADDLGIEYFLPVFSSLSLEQRGQLIPKSAIRDVQKNGFSYHCWVYYGCAGNDPECYMVPDPRTLIQLPWKPEVGWVQCFPYLHGQPLAQCPRRCLLRQIERARKLGYVLKTGIEPEFVLLKKDSEEGFLSNDKQPYGMKPLVKTSKLLMRITDAMDTLAWGPSKIEHEVSSNQYEIVFNYADAMTTADRWSFVKFMVQSLAEEEGMRATFMPLPPTVGGPFPVGNGMHVHYSLWSVEDNKELFPDAEGELGLSDIGRHFLSGVLDHMKGMTAIFCPTVNSYKRLHATTNFLHSIAFGVDSRWPSLRVVTTNGQSNRFELRPPDAAANPLLLHAALLAAGMDGIAKKKDPDPELRSQVELPLGLPLEGIEVMPNNLFDALRQLESDTYIIESLGKEVVAKYVQRKTEHWDASMKEVTPWELEFIDSY